MISICVSVIRGVASRSKKSIKESIVFMRQYGFGYALQNARVFGGDSAQCHQRFLHALRRTAQCDSIPNAKLADMNRMILALLLLSCLTFGGGCASERPVDIQPLYAKLTRLKIGMTSKDVSALVGPPLRSKQAATAARRIVEWYYVEPQFYAGTPSGQLTTKVAFTNGRVSSIQGLSVTP